MKKTAHLLTGFSYLLSLSFVLGCEHSGQGKTMGSSERFHLSICVETNQSRPDFVYGNDKERWTAPLGVHFTLTNVGSHQLVIHDYIFSGIVVRILDVEDNLVPYEEVVRPVVPAPPRAHKLDAGKSFTFRYSKGSSELPHLWKKSQSDGLYTFVFEKQRYSGIAPGDYRIGATWTDPKNRGYIAQSKLVDLLLR